MGLFSKWALFQAPEVVLERQLQANPYHPFLLASNNVQNNERVFVYTSRQYCFYIYLLVSIASFLFAIIWPSTGNDSEYVVFAVCVFLLSTYLCLESWAKWSIVLEPSSHHYSVYRGSRLLVSQHCHNIYIRLVSDRTGSRSSHYQLVLDGWGLETTVYLTRHTTNRKKLRQLAQELTNNLQINYFDAHNTSKHHIIRHNRPFTGATGPSETDPETNEE